MTIGPADFRVKPVDDDDLLWQDRADSLSADSLPLLRQAAERWAAAVGGLLAAASLAALLKGPADFERIEGWTGLLGRLTFAAAAISGVVAVVAAALAAQPGPGTLPLATAARLRALHQQRFDRAALELHVARLASLASAALLATAALTVWLGPKKQPDSGPNAAVRLSSGKLVCGRLSLNGTMLTVQAGERRESIPVSEVVRIRDRGKSTC